MPWRLPQAEILSSCGARYGGAACLGTRTLSLGRRSLVHAAGRLSTAQGRCERSLRASSFAPCPPPLAVPCRSLCRTRVANPAASPLDLANRPPPLAAVAAKHATVWWGLLRPTSAGAAVVGTRLPTHRQRLCRRSAAPLLVIGWEGQTVHGWQGGRTCWQGLRRGDAAVGERREVFGSLL